ncbi:MAG: putative toxin-antitoxin system toxin component, PIN family [Tepidiformaceae bacterium]
MRVVLDTNVLVSGLISPAGSPAEIHQAWRRGDFELVTAEPLLLELVEVLSYPRIRKRLHWSDGQLSDFAELYRATAILVTPAQALVVARDPDDDRVLEAAQAGHADFIVSGDRDLLDLREFVGIPILTPTGFLTMLAVG